MGERLGRYDVEKHSAIEREDYDTAKQKKEQMDAYRLNVYQQLELHNLLDISQVNIHHYIFQFKKSMFSASYIPVGHHYSFFSIECMNNLLSWGPPAPVRLVLWYVRFPAE